MMAKREEAAIVSDFGERYEARDVAIACAVEEAVLGTACGANGYTTLRQAERLADHLPLDAGHLVLDLGCGCGWPGLHLAERFGCTVVGADLPLEGLRRAQRNSLDRRVETRCRWVRATARALPFGSGVFDAIVHADALC